MTHIMSSGAKICQVELSCRHLVVRLMRKPSEFFRNVFLAERSYRSQAARFSWVEETSIASPNKHIEQHHLRGSYIQCTQNEAELEHNFIGSTPCMSTAAIVIAIAIFFHFRSRHICAASWFEASPFARPVVPKLVF